MTVNEIHAKISKVSSIEVNPFSCLFSRDFQSLKACDRSLMKLFKRNLYLKENYATPQQLWNQLVGFAWSACNNWIVTLTKNFTIIVFNLSKDYVHVVKMPIIEGVIVCNLHITERKILIGCLNQVLIFDWRKGVLNGLDFSVFSDMKPVLLQIDIRNQIKYLHLWKQRITFPKTDYNGDFKVIQSVNGIVIKGVIGILYTKEQFNALNRTRKTSESESNIQSDFESNTCVLHLTNVSYVQDEHIEISRQVLKVEYSIQQESRCLILKSNSKCKTIIVALNSFHKYYCQLLFVKTGTSYAINLRSVDFISSTDILPNDNYGRISMLILDIAWTPNDNFAVVVFCNNYFCILSALGQPLNLLQGNSISHFYEIPKLDKHYNNLRVSNNTICLFGNTKVITIELESIFSLQELWKSKENRLNVDDILKLVLEFPELTTNPSIINMINETLNKELVHVEQQNIIIEEDKLELKDNDVAKSMSFVVNWSPDSAKKNLSNDKDAKLDYNSPVNQNVASIDISKEFKDLANNTKESNDDSMKDASETIRFKNPFPTEPTADVETIIKDGYLLIRSTCWSYSIPSKVFELIQTELNNIFKLLYLKNDPIYSLHLIWMCKRIIQPIFVKSIVKNIRFYGLTYNMQELMSDLHTESFSFGKSNALLMLYCLIQFRNFKATHFNILYFILASIIKNQLKDYETSFNIVETIINIIKEKIFLKIYKKQGFFDIQAKTLFNYYGTLHQLVFEICDTSFLQSTKNNSSEIMYDKKECSLTKVAEKELLTKGRECTHSLLNLYSVEKIDKIIESINKCTGNTLKHNEFSPLHSCISLIKKGNFDDTLKFIYELNGTVKLETNTYFTIILAFACLSTIALSILQGKRKFTINPREAHTFLYKILSGDNLIKVFEQLKTPINTNEFQLKSFHSIVLNCTNREKEIYNGIGILLQISEVNIAIEILRSSSRSICPILSLMILNNKLNESFKRKINIQQYLKLCIETTSILVKNHIPIIIRSLIKFINEKSSRYFYLFSTAMSLSSKLASAIIAYSTLPWLVSRLQWLLQINDIQLERVNQNLTYNITLCPFILKLIKVLGNCSKEACQQFFCNFFPNMHYANLFNYLIQESIQILAVCIKTEIIEINPIQLFKKELLKVSKIFPIEFADGLKDAIEKLIMIIWKLALLLSIQGLNEVKSKKPLNKLWLAGYIIRLSLMANNEQQELAFIRHGFSILKCVEYSKLDVSQSEDCLKSLANAFDIYTEKWESTLKTDKETILSLIEKGNLEVYKALSIKMTKKKPVIFRGLTKTLQRTISSDIRFYGLLGNLNEILNSLVQDGSELSESTKKAKIIKMNLRKVLKNIKNITKIPKGDIIERKSNWIIKQQVIFDEENDEYKKDIDIINSLGKIFINKKLKVSQDKAITSRSIGTCRSSNKQVNIVRYKEPKKLFITVNSTLNVKDIERLKNEKLKKVNRDELIESVFVHETGANMIFSTICKYLYRRINIIQKAHHSSTLKRNATPLVPLHSRSFDHQKSLSFTTQATKGIQPFSLYSVKKERLCVAKMNTQNDTNTQCQTNPNLRIPTDESNDKLTNYYYTDNRYINARIPRRQKPFSAIKVPAQGASHHMKKEEIETLHNKRIKRTSKSQSIEEVQSRLERINKEHDKLKASANLLNWTKKKTYSSIINNN